MVTDAGEIHAVQDPNLDNPAYSFTASSNSGMLLSSFGTLDLQATTDQCVTLNSSAITMCVPVRAPVGDVTGPAYSFTSNTNSGIYSDVADTVKTSVDSVDVWATHPAQNVVFGSGSSGFGNGSGVVRFDETVIAPSSAPTNGGLLYVDGNSFVFHDTSNVTHDLTSDSIIGSVNSSTDNGVVRFNISSNQVQDTSTILITDVGEVLTVGGFRFTNSVTSGLRANGFDSLRFYSGTKISLTLTSSATTVPSDHVLACADGTAGAPSIAFSAGSSTGLYLPTSNMVGCSVSGSRALSVDGTENVAFGTDTPNFAGGEGVVYFSDVTTVPTGTLSNGGILYADGSNLFFHDKDASAIQISGTHGLVSSTDNRIVNVTDTAGQQFGESSFTMTTQCLGPDGSAGTPTYKVDTGSAAGWWGTGTTLKVGAGSDGLDITPTSVSVVSGVLTKTDTLRVSGSMTETFAGTTSTRNMPDISGTFVWSRDGTTIFQTTSSRDVDLLGNFAVCTGGTGNFTIGYNGTEFALDVVNAADSLDVSVGGTQATFSNTGISCSNLVSGQFRSENYAFTSAPTTGLVVGPTLDVNGKITVEVQASSQLLLLGGSISSGNRVTSIGYVTTAPTSLPSSGAYMYATNEFMRVANRDADVALNGPLARAKISRTQTIVSGAIDLIDTLVDVESNILVVDTAVPGAGTITGTADTAGWWEISGEAHWVTNAAGFRRIRIKVGGVVVGDSTQNAVAGIETRQQVRVCVNVAASAVVTFEVEQNTGGNLDVDVIGTVVFMG